MDAFVQKWNGRQVTAYGGECVALVAQYLVERGLPIAYANAKDWWGHPAISGAYDFIVNNPNDYNQVPTKGDVLVWNGGLAGSGGYGHIAIFDHINGPGSFTSFDQNWGGRQAHFVTHNWNNIIGWFRPKQATPTGGDKPMTPQEEANAYQIVLGRAMEHAGSGRTGYKFIVDAQAEVNAQRAGVRAQVEQLTNNINALNAHVTQLTSDDNADKAQIKAGLDEIGRLTGELTTATDKLKDLENHPQVVYTHDAETSANVNKILQLVTTIFDYFKGQYKSFSKYITKEK